MSTKTPVLKRRIPPHRLGLLVVLSAAISLSGCRSRLRGPDLGGLYDRAAQTHQEGRNPVIVIPGILGSRLVDQANGETVWGAFAGEYSDPDTPSGARILSHPMGEGEPLHKLQDSVYAESVLEQLTISLLGLPIVLSAYHQILGILGAGGYRDESLGTAGAVNYGTDHYTCFQYAYDWRRDLIESSRNLHKFILERKEAVKKATQERFGRPQENIKFDLVAHSMGGLVARYYLRYGDADLPEDGSLPEVTWAGREHVDRVILVGTPNAGSLKSLFNLVYGVEFSFFLPEFSPAIVSTMPAIYQLLPRSRHQPVTKSGSRQSVDLLDFEVWKQNQWGLLDPEQDEALADLLPGKPAPERRRIAEEHVKKCLRRASHFQAAVDRPTAYPPDLELYLLLGDSVATEARAEVGREGGLELSERAAGDGTVLRSSALLDERLDGNWTPQLRSPVDWSYVSFLFSDHLGVTRDPAFADQVLYLLLEKPRRPVTSTAP